MISRIHLARITTALLILVSLPACYTAQVLSGGAGLLAKREPIDEVLADDGLSADERSKLELSQRIVDFAVSDLQLPDNGSYRSYVRLDRPHVVWNVVATPALSIEPLEWCFPIVGCVSYRGYFKEKRAGDFAAKLERKGNDVAVRGADAYSTLGRFRDPVLSTFLNRRGIDLAALLFHEMAHQRLYIKDDTAFNESFATVVEHEGVRRWLVAQGPGWSTNGISISASCRCFSTGAAASTGCFEAIFPTRRSTTEKRNCSPGFEPNTSGQSATGGATIATTPGSIAHSTTPGWPRSPTTSIWSLLSRYCCAAPPGRWKISMQRQKSWAASRPTNVAVSFSSQRPATTAAERGSLSLRRSSPRQ
jgi:predicted aminopeptidase